MSRKFITEPDQSPIPVYLIATPKERWGSVVLYVSSKNVDFGLEIVSDFQKVSQLSEPFRVYSISSEVETPIKEGRLFKLPATMAQDEVARFILNDLGGEISAEEHDILWEIVSSIGGDVGSEFVKSEEIEGILEEKSSKRVVIHPEKIAISREEVRIEAPKKIKRTLANPTELEKKTSMLGGGGLQKPEKILKLDSSIEKDFSSKGRISRRGDGLLALAANSEEKSAQRKKSPSFVRGGFWAKPGIRRKGRRRGVWRSVAIVVGCLLLLLMAGSVIGIGFVWRARANFLEVVQNSSNVFVSGGSVEDLKKTRSLLLAEEEKVKRVWSVASPILPMVGQGSGDLDFLFGAVEKQAVALESLQRAQISSEMLAFSVWRGGGEPISQLAQESQTNLEQALKDVSQFHVELQRLQNSDEEFPGFEQGKNADQLQEKRKNLSIGQKITSLLPALLVEGEKKTYVVFVQNPSELRATGGYASALILLRFESGRLSSYEVLDIYEMDKNLRGFVAPPEEMQRLLGESRWNLREANWSPDFPTVARQVEWFVGKQKGERVDGVIGMNALTLRRILEILGPLTIADGENITSQNLLEKSQLKNEVGEGGLPNKNGGFMSEVSRAILQRMENSNPHTLSKVFEEIGKQAQDGQVVLSSSQSEVEKSLGLLGWTGKIMTPPCPAQFVASSCYVDTLYVVDTNIGINRANYYVKKSMDHSVFLSKASANHVITLRYSNNSPSSAWPAGTYKNYIRVYVPDFSELQGVLIDGKELPLDQIFVGYENGKRKIAFLSELLPGASSSVVIKYSTNIKASGAFSYALFVQKQPGTEDYPSAFSLNIQRPLMAKTVAPLAGVVDNVIQYDLKMSGHQFMAVEVVE